MLPVQPALSAEMRRTMIDDPFVPHNNRRRPAYPDSGVGSLIGSWTGQNTMDANARDELFGQSIFATSAITRSAVSAEIFRRLSTRASNCIHEHSLKTKVKRGVCGPGNYSKGQDSRHDASSLPVVQGRHKGLTVCIYCKSTCCGC
jgi:hypothetical protein